MLLFEYYLSPFILIGSDHFWTYIINVLFLLNFQVEIDPDL